MSELPPEKLNALRQLVHSHVSECGFQDQIRRCVAESMGEMRESDGGRVDERTVMRVLEERGMVDQVLQSLNLSTVGVEGEGATVRGASSSPGIEKTAEPATNQQKCESLTCR